MRHTTLLLAGLALLVGDLGKTSAGIIEYDSSADFAAATPGAYTWNFAGLAGAYTDLSGPGSISLNFAHVIASNGFEHLFQPPQLTGNSIYINPQAGPASGDIHFANGATSFGFDSIWSNSFSVQNETLHLFDTSNNLVGTVALTPQTAGVQGPIDTHFGFSVYEGFIGFTSTTPISRIQITQQAGADYYYNFRWNEADQPAASPEPATLTMLCIGIAGMAGCTWKKRRKL